MRNWLIAAGMALALGTGSASAQGTPAADDGTTLGNCMVENHTDEHENQFRNMLIDALNDDTPALNKSALAMGMGAIMLATQKYGLLMTDLQSPRFKKAAEVYGKAVASNILEGAMGKIGVR